MDTADYLELHRDALVVDLHNDAIVAHIRHGSLSFEPQEGGDTPAPEDPGAPAPGPGPRHPGTIAWLRGRAPAPSGRTAIQADFPKLRQGGVDAGLFAVDVTRAYQNHLAYALDGVGYFLSDVEQSGAGVTVARRAEDVVRAKAEGKLAAILAIEHSDVTERSLNVLRALYEVGVRSIGLTHHTSSWAADGCFEAREGVGLTHYGARLVREMNRLGILVDLAHASEAAFFSTLEVSARPVAFTHGNARALCDHPRNLTDAQLAALAANGGVIGLSYVPVFVDRQAPTIGRLLDHVDHIAEVAGIGTVALGGDFDGGGTLLADATEVPLLTRGLLERGYAEGDIRKVLGLNALRVLQAAIG
jgi:membrane dipeptidase